MPHTSSNMRVISGLPSLYDESPYIVTSRYLDHNQRGAGLRTPICSAAFIQIPPKQQLSPLTTMGYKRDQNYHPQTFRNPSASSDALSELPPPYVEAQTSIPAAEASYLSDQPPIAARSDSNGRRKVLLVYIHGFMGNETSFQSFPRQVHEDLCRRLAGTFTATTIMHPKYKCRKKIEFARDELVSWYILNTLSEKKQ